MIFRLQLPRGCGVLRGVEILPYLYGTLVGLLVLAGLVGCVVPLLPGTTLILGAVLLQKLLLPGTLSWGVFAWIAGFWLLSVLADLACTLVGTRLLGGTKWGMAGATGGALAGMFFSLPALVLGTIFGAVLAEKWLGRQSMDESLRSGAGAALGLVLGTFARLGCALVMVGLQVIATVLVLRAG